MKKIISIIGARPQFIKMVMVKKELRKYEKFTELLLHTGQHYDKNMSDVFFQDLEIDSPNFFFRLGSGNHGRQTGLMLKNIEKILVQEMPDFVLIYGDTNSTLAGALAAAKLHIPIGHVESGLRSFDMKMPEEINRKISDHLSTLLFCPSKNSVNNAKNEGISSDKLFLVGDIMYDAVLFFSEKVLKKNTVLSALKLDNKNYILATIHRAENTDDPVRLKKLMLNLEKLSKKYTLVLPLHPRTRDAMKRYGIIFTSLSTLKLIEPVGYLTMSMLEKNAAIIITDSGGVQKEAYFHGVPCITIRDTTEWPELIDEGWNCLCSSLEFDLLLYKVERMVQKTGERPQLYGNGNAAVQIVKHLYNFIIT